MKVTIGGDRLGSGKKVKTALHAYERSTHNLSQTFTSSMQVGVLYPFLCIPAMRGDKFNIKLSADARTIPTKGPLFGSFKMQVDLFQCPVRLYQAILHNNPLSIGLQMNQVKFPMLDIVDDYNTHAFSNTSLLKYLGMSGLGHREDDVESEITNRHVNAIPALAYYEIFKTYYSNKQEEYAYLIGTEYSRGDMGSIQLSNMDDERILYLEIIEYNAVTGFILKVNTNYQPDGWQKRLTVNFLDSREAIQSSYTFEELQKKGWIKESPTTANEYLIKWHNDIGAYTAPFFIKFEPNERFYNVEKLGLQPFKLSNIDEMRLKLLSHHALGEHFIITEQNVTGSSSMWGSDDGENEGLPYTALVKMQVVSGTDERYTQNGNPMNGLVVKTYQSDMFNNWVNTEWIDGDNGIANITAISTTSGKIKIDTINLSEKLYNMLNRIAVSDGSYESWQDAVYTDTPKRHIESPIYLGGMSSEIVFEEIVQTAQGGEDTPLGTLGGKGKLLKRKGGYVSVKCSEACFIIGIVSLTPRINYTQGNEFYMTELKSMDDFHKPALDGIGFQNLIGERLAWWDTALAPNNNITARSVIGKLPAWMEYMTAVNKCYGDFAEPDGKGFMNLLRQYDRTNSNEIGDATTYIDPRKYNYAFAYTDIDAQNFWVQIYSEITARRLMSAKQIPNL